MMVIDTTIYKLNSWLRRWLFQRSIKLLVRKSSSTFIDNIFVQKIFFFGKGF